MKMSKLFKKVVMSLMAVFIGGCATAPQWAKENARASQEQVLQSNIMELNRACQTLVTRAMILASSQAKARGERWDGSYIEPACVHENENLQRRSRAGQSVVIPSNTGITVEEASLAGLGDEDDGECGNRVNRAIVSKTVGAILADGTAGYTDNKIFYDQGTDECNKRKIISEMTGWKGFWNRLAGTFTAGVSNTGLGVYVGVVPRYGYYGRYGYPYYYNGRRQRLWRRIGYDSYGQFRTTHIYSWGH